MKKHAELFLAPIILCLLLLAVFWGYGLFPFGSKTVAWGDMTQQAVPLMLQLKQLLAEGRPLSLSFLSGGGMNFWGVFLFFTASPFSFLAALLKERDYITWINLLLLFKLMVCAASAQYFFKAKYPKTGLWVRVMLSLSYALGGYALLYYQNFVWLDIVILFPLLWLSAESLLRGGKSLPYLVLLCAVLAIQVYLGVMVVIYLAIFGALFCLTHRCPGAALRLGAMTISAGLLTAPFWLCFFLQYRDSARGKNLLEGLAGSHFSTQLLTTLPVLLTVPLLALAFSRPHDRDSRKNLFLFVFMCIPVFMEPINMMWHFGSYQAFPVRYGYLTILTGLAAAAAALSSPAKPGQKSRRIFWLCLIYTAASLGLMAAFLTVARDSLTTYISSLWVDAKQFLPLMLIFLLTGGSLFSMNWARKQGLISRRAFTVFFCTMIAGNVLFQSAVFIGFAARNTDTWQEAAGLAGALEENGFYRVKNRKKYFDANLLGGLGYNTLDHYTSLTPEHYLYGMKTLGYSSYWMEVTSVGGTLLADAFFQNRYSVVRYDHLTPNDHETAVSGRYRMVDNGLILPLGTVIDAEQSLQGISRAEAQQILFYAVTGSDSALIESFSPTELRNIRMDEQETGVTITLSKGQNALEYVIPVTGTKELYFDCFHTLSNRLTEAINDSVKVTVNGKLIENTYPTKWQNGILHLGTFTDETVTVTLNLLKNIEAKSFGIFSLDPGVLEEAVSQVPDPGLSVSGTTITGTIDAPNGGLLLLPFPFDAGYHAVVNGFTVSPHPAFDFLLAVPLERGSNTVTITYRLPGLRTGLLLSGCGAVFLSAFWLIRKKHPSLQKLERAAEYALFLFAGAILLVLYLLPVVIWLLARLV